jgi:hypothetical protein
VTSKPKSPVFEMIKSMVAKGWLWRPRNGSPPSYAVMRDNSLRSTRIGCAG